MDLEEGILTSLDQLSYFGLAGVAILEENPGLYIKVPLIFFFFLLGGRGIIAAAHSVAP